MNGEFRMTKFDYFIIQRSAFIIRNLKPRHKSLDQNPHRILQQSFQRFQEGRSYRAIYCTVIA